MENLELKNLVNDFGGGRQKSNDLSQKLYDLAAKVLPEFDGKPYSEIELFSEYLKEVGKKTSVHLKLGLEKPN